MAKKKSAGSKLWADVDITTDFEECLQNADEVDIGEYNTEKGILFSANVNYARQLTRLSDSLKPVQRRILYTMYTLGLTPGHKKKSISAKGATTEIHPHGGDSVYATMVGMAQYWKMPVPMIKMFGSYGTETSPIYAADRYTEMQMSKYAYDCFFKDFDNDCVQMIYNTSACRDEPVSLPSRYPNVLINGGMGIAVGNSYRIPPYNIEDIVRETKKQLYNPTTGHIYLTPDLPTGCDVVDDGTSIKEICETGKGTLRMRAKTEIVDEGKNWAIHVTNLPWNVTQSSITKSLVKLTKEGQLPIKDWQDRCEQEYLADGQTVVSHVDLWIIIDKAHDPYAVRDKLFKKTQLDESVSVNFKVVLEGLELGELSLADLIRQWITERREYKRRLLNKRISMVMARIDTLKILIEICSGDNLAITTNIIKNSDEADVAKNLVKQYGMSSFQAEQICDLKMRAINKEAVKRYKAELKERKEELDRLYKLVRSEKDIDDIIAAELDELKKYYQPRQSDIINLDNGQIMDTQTEYFLIATKKGGIKKVSVDSVERTKKGFGNFEAKDYPTHILRVRNLDSILFVDSFGKFSVIKAGEIDTMVLADAPAKAYTTTKLEGEIISMQYFQSSEQQKWLKKTKMGDLYLVTLSRDGFARKTPIDEIIELTEDGRKTIKNRRLTKLKDKDFLMHCGYYLQDTPIIIYTREGNYNYVYVDGIPNFSRDAVGNRLVQLEGTDYCVGCCSVNPEAKYMVIVTEKGCAKKCDIEFIGEPSASKSTTYLATLDANDGVIYVDTPLESIDVCTRLGHEVASLDSIKMLGRKAKCPKKFAVPTGDNIIRVVTN